MEDENDEKELVIRKSVSLPAAFWQRIEDYQFANRIKKDSVALRNLLQLGLDALEREREPKP